MDTDKTTIHIVSAGLAVIVLVVVGALAFAVSSGSLDSTQRGQALVALGAIATTALGALASLLAHTGAPNAAADAPAALAAALPAPAGPAKYEATFDGKAWSFAPAEAA